MAVEPGDTRNEALMGQATTQKRRGQLLAAPVNNCSDYQNLASLSILI